MSASQDWPLEPEDQPPPADTGPGDRGALLARKAALQAQLARDLELSSPSEADSAAYTARLDEFHRVCAALDGERPTQPPPAPGDVPTVLVRCPSCTNQLHVRLVDGLTSYACPSCSVRFKIDASAIGAPGPSADASEGAAAPEETPSSPARLYQAACPRCAKPCRFTMPEGVDGTKLAVTCHGCAKPFAIQV